MGDTLLVDGGIQSLQITGKQGADVFTKVLDGGIMKSRRAAAARLCASCPAYAGALRI